MHIRRDGAGGEVAIEILGAELHADLGAALKVHRPLEGGGGEALGFEEFDGFRDRVRGDDEIHILGDHGLLRPMVDGHATDGAPKDIRPLKAVDKAGLWFS